MKKTFCLFALSALVTVSAQTLEPRTLMTNRAASIVTSALNAPDNVWKAGKGTWRFVDGVLNGSELKADRHAATYRRPLEFQDAVIAFEFRLGEAKTITLSLNDASGHVARVLVDREGFVARKDDHDHAGPDKALNFNRITTRLEPTRWYTMLLEVRGAELLARLVLEDTVPLERMLVSFGAHEMIGVTKTNLGFTVLGENAGFRNLRVHQALENTTWNDTKRQLEANRSR
jgi:hypothetical protein